MTDRVLIVGGGVSGLATAYLLGRLGISSRLFEKTDRLGGLIKTDFIEGCRLEAGPDSYIATKAALTDLARELDGLGDQIIGSNDQARRIFIVRGGKLIPMPQGMVMMVPGAWGPILSSELFGAGTKLRFLREMLFAPQRRSEDVTVGRFVRDHFGDEALEYLTEPLLAGIYGGDAASLSAESVLPRFVAYERQYGSLIKGIRAERRATPPSGSLFRSFRDGMQGLIDSLASAIKEQTTVLHREVTKVDRTATGWRVEASGQSFDGPALVLACPASIAGSLLNAGAPDIAADLSAIPYSSAILVTLVYDRAALGHPLEGFGFLVPRGERQTVAAATWVSTKFPSRIPAHLAAIRAFIVGEQAARFLRDSNEDLISLVRQDLTRLMGIASLPLFSTFYKWPDSMPQYVVGHKERQKRIGDALLLFPGLHLVGNAYDGVGIPDCVRLAGVAAGVIRQRLAHRY